MKGAKSMDYGIIGKIEKAKCYAQERDRIQIRSLTVDFEGRNNRHTVNYKDSTWHCDCEFFQTRGNCSHTMALEIILEDMIPSLIA
ncbi:MAG: SWIM zinc finger family protein [Chloroflexota bacterium]